MSENLRWRDRARHGLKGYFERRGFPRVMLSIILLATGLAGFGISYFLLKAGLDQMAIRYPIAVFGAYGLLLLLLRLWVEWERHSFDATDPVLEEDLQKEPPGDMVVVDRRDQRSWFDWLDVSSGLDFDDGCLPALILGLLLGLCALVIASVVGAPVLIAELFVDIFLTTVLYRRLRRASDEHWLSTAVRKTFLQVLGAAILLALLGLVFDLAAPNSSTFGEAIRELF